MELTKDDEKARRICSLALEFMNAKSPISSTAIAREFYPGVSQDSFRRAFARDRESLAACGIVIEELRNAGTDSSWVANEGLSFANGTEIDAFDAAVLDITCRTLLDEPGFPFAEDLRFALAKINRAFAEATSAPRDSDRRENRQLSCLRSCMIAGHAAHITYVDAKGNKSERLIAPYGFFDLREEIYLVAPRIGDDSLVLDDSMRVYNVSRMKKTQEVPGVTFQIPEDFSPRDWCYLPFQLGPSIGDATFEVPREQVEELRRHTIARGSFATEGNRTFFTTFMSSLDDAASWAISQGIVPVAPEELCFTWNTMLKGVLARG